MQCVDYIIVNNTAEAELWLQPKSSSLSSFDVKGLRLPGAGERDPSRRDDKVGEVDVNRPVMVVEFYE